LVFKLCKLDLQLAFAGASVAGEDVEDELGAIDDRAGQSRFDVARLRWRQVVIEENEAGAGGGDGGDDFVELAAADQGGGIGAAAALDQDGGDGCAGRPG
jgi:hypothetical protein